MVRVLPGNVVEYEGISTSATFHSSYLISGMLTFILITLFFFLPKNSILFLLILRAKYFSIFLLNFLLL